MCDPPNAFVPCLSSLATDPSFLRKERSSRRAPVPQGLSAATLLTFRSRSSLGQGPSYAP